VEAPIVAAAGVGGWSREEDGDSARQLPLCQEGRRRGKGREEARRVDVHAGAGVGEVGSMGASGAPRTSRRRRRRRRSRRRSDRRKRLLIRRHPLRAAALSCLSPTPSALPPGPGRRAPHRRPAALRLAGATASVSTKPTTGSGGPARSCREERGKTEREQLMLKVINAD
jgi:hypothetical protein